LLITQRLFGIKVGPVWVIYPEDLESFSRLRRPRGRPRKGQPRPGGEAERRDRIDNERTSVGTDEALLKPHGPR
jgi:hypothetical protein